MVKNTRTNGIGLSPLERFWKMARKLPSENACWAWIGKRNKQGHPRFYFNNRIGLAHRFAYEEWIGDIPVGWDLHHVCGNPWCVNPSHLKPLPHGAHTKYHAPMIQHPTREYCIRGHPLTPDNRMANGGKNTWCRECRRMHQWCLRHGLRITEFTPEQLRALVPPRKR
jgi:hypothetical protein